MNLTKLTQKQLMKRCAWCHKVMPEGKACFGAGGKVWPSAKPLLAGHEGTLMPMRLSTGREIIAVIHIRFGCASRGSRYLFPNVLRRVRPRDIRRHPSRVARFELVP